MHINTLNAHITTTNSATMNTYKITAITESVINGKSYLPTDKKRINRILESGYDIQYTADWCYPSLSKNLMRLATKIKKNHLVIDYHRKHKTNKEMCDVTRAKAEACISAGDTSRNVRAGLWGDNCYDFDMCCAHHALILSALKKDDEIDIDCQYPTLNDYVNNKKEFRKNVASFFDDDLRKAKDAICAITFGSSLKNAFKDSKQSGYPKSCIVLRDELAKFTELIVTANPDYAKVVEKEVTKRNKKAIDTFVKQSGKTESDAKEQGIGVKNWRHTIMSEWCCNKESICMESVIRFCIDKGIIQERRFDNSKDGVMIPKDDVNAYVEREGLEVADIPAMFRDVVFDLGFNIDFEEKPMDDDHVTFWETIHSCEADVAFEPEHCKMFDKSYFHDLDTYGEKKKYWELFFALIDEMSCFVYTMSTPEKSSHGVTRITRKMVYYSTRQLKDVFGNLKSNRYQLNKATGEQTNLPFIGEWLNDNTLRSYHKIDNLPYAGVYDANRCTKEVMNAFVGYPEHIWEGDVNYSDEFMFKKLRPFFLVLANLVGEQDVGYKGIDIKGWDDLSRFKHMQHLLAVMGHRIARPDEPRKPYTPVIHGVQGTAKNVCMNVFGSMVGDEHYICTSNPDDFFSTHAEGFVGKIITVMNELDLNGSSKLKNKMKGIISEDTAVCNRKFVSPFKYTVCSVNIILSNERVPIVLEMNANRRYMILRCNDTLAKKFTQDKWKKCIDHFQSTEFLRCLRQFLVRFDYDNYDFTGALRYNHNSSAYKQMLSHFFPADLRFFKAFVDEQWYDMMTPDASKAFHENASWDKEVRVLSSDMQSMMLRFFEDENQTKSIEKYKQKQRFNNHITDLQLPITKFSEPRKPVKWSFKPKEMYLAMVEKGLVDVEALDEQTQIALGEIVKDDEDFEFDDDMF